MWWRVLRRQGMLVGVLLGRAKMKASKLLAMLAVAGFCGTAESHARSYKLEIKQLEKERVERVEEYREAKERVDELSSGISFNAGGDGECGMRASGFVMAEGDDELLEVFGDEVVSAHEGGNSGGEKDALNINWKVSDPEVIRERELEEERMRAAAREIAKIDKAIRKQKGSRPR